MTPTDAAPRWKVVAAFAAVYIIWGSTYLAIRFAIETMPPFLMAGVRFVIAGALLYWWARWKGAPRPERAHWKATTIIGGLLLLGGNGGVVWAEQRVPSGIAALIVAIVPVWIALMEWRMPGGRRPGWQVTAGLALGSLGLLLLAAPGAASLGARVDLIGVGALLIATLCWSLGSVLSKRFSLPASPLVTTGMEMLMGGVLLLVAGLVTGELPKVHLAEISFRSGMALVYLITFGALIGFTAYLWLLRVGSPTRAATYAYVNPVVAVFLGWSLAGEAISARTIIAMAVIVGAVVLITSSKPRVPKLEPASKQAPEGALSSEY
ncbi:MAG TPA: drug/metabolite exporter YedA [Gemmatimonadales bacterium]|nr:drug/metabolite exporter YedA [Gemmatimonadales bacterium]